MKITNYRVLRRGLVIVIAGIFTLAGGQAVLADDDDRDDDGRRITISGNSTFSD